ncbi:MAG: hypothetical protein J5886_01565 [Bacteroidales bacterium]|nr:hypothetical protein [Bacteroidales bacterium]
MRFFISRLLFSALAFLVFLSLVDRPYSWIAERSNNVPNEAWRDLIQGTVDASVVVLGNSRAASDFDTFVMDSVLGVRSYDLQMKGCGMDRLSYMYDLYRKLNRKPDVVITCMDFLSMNPTVEVPSREQFFPLFYYKDFRETVFPKEAFSWGEKHLPMWRWHSYNPLSLIVCYPKKTRQGFEPHTMGGYPFSKSSTDSLCFFENTESILPLWESFLERNRADSIKTVLVFPPLYSDVPYASGHKERMHSSIDSLASRFGAFVLDYDDQIISSDSTCFQDFYHLNEKGAKLFTAALCEDLLKLGIAR